MVVWICDKCMDPEMGTGPCFWAGLEEDAQPTIDRCMCGKEEAFWAEASAKEIADLVLHAVSEMKDRMY